MTGLPKTAKSTLQIVNSARVSNAKRTSALAAVLIFAVGSSAAAFGYGGCIAPQARIALPEELDNSRVRTCLSDHVGAVANVVPSFVVTSNNEAKALVESGIANLTILPRSSYDSGSFEINAVVAGVNQKQPRLPEVRDQLGAGTGYQEMALVAATATGYGEIETVRSVGDEQALRELEQWSFSSIDGQKDGTTIHYHLVGIDCR